MEFYDSHEAHPGHQWAIFLKKPLSLVILENPGLASGFLNERGTLRAVTCLQPVCPPCQYFPSVLDLLIPGLENALSPLD